MGYGDWDDSEGNYETREQFYHPGGRSALLTGKRNKPCPTCGQQNCLTAADVKKGYQCDRCADTEEGNFY